MSVQQKHKSSDLVVVVLCLCLNASYLLYILLKNTQLQALVEANFTMLPDVFQLPLVMQHLVNDVQDMVHSLGVVS